MITAGDGAGNELHDKLIFFLFDAGRHGNTTAMQAAFKKIDGRTLPKNMHTLYVTYEEASLAARRQRVKGCHALNQVEMITCVSRNPPKIADKPRLFYSGSTLGNCIGPVSAPLPSDGWLLPTAEKRLLYGRAARVELPPEAGIVVDMEPLPAGGDQEPATFHPINRKLFEELTHTFELDGWVNLTGMDGVLEAHCVERKLPVVSFMHTAHHKQLLTAHLTKEIFAAFQDPASKLYQAGLGEILGPSRKRGGALPAAAAGKRRKTEAAQPKKGKAKGKAKGGARRTKLLDKLKAMQEEPDEAEAEHDDEDDEDLDDDDNEDDTE
jgi:hypothetical protein